MRSFRHRSSNRKQPAAVRRAAKEKEAKELQERLAAAGSKGEEATAELSKLRERQAELEKELAAGFVEVERMGYI